MATVPHLLLPMGVVAFVLVCECGPHCLVVLLLCDCMLHCAIVLYTNMLQAVQCYWSHENTVSLLPVA